MRTPPPADRYRARGGHRHRVPIWAGVPSLGAGPGLPALDGLAAAPPHLKPGEAGLSLRRFKTGTPPGSTHGGGFLRNGAPGGRPGLPFPLFETEQPPENPGVGAGLTYTNAGDPMRSSANLGPIPYFRMIEGVGTPLLPPLRTRWSALLIRSATIETHGPGTEGSSGIQGLLPPLPEDAEVAMLRTIPGLDTSR